MAQMTELMLPCLDAAEVKSVAEVGAFAGDLTRVLVAWAAGAGARGAGDRPGSAAERCWQLADEHPELELVRQTSLEALPQMTLPTRS